MSELYAKSMELLMEHYDPVTGRRRSVVKFDQVIRPDVIVSDDVFAGLGDKRKGH